MQRSKKAYRPNGRLKGITCFQPRTMVTGVTARDITSSTSAVVPVWNKISRTGSAPRLLLKYSHSSTPKGTSAPMCVSQVRSRAVFLRSQRLILGVDTAVFRPVAAVICLLSLVTALLTTDGLRRVIIWIIIQVSYLLTIPIKQQRLAPPKLAYTPLRSLRPAWMIDIGIY